MKGDVGGMTGLEVFAMLLQQGGGASFLSMLYNPQFRPEPYIRAMATVRKGGLDPSNVEDVLKDIKGFAAARNNLERIAFAVDLTKKYGLVSITAEDLLPVTRLLKREAEDFAERCWHPLAPADCSLVNGRPKITKAHSIQNNRILKAISKDGHVMMFDKETASFTGVPIGKNLASTFRGMCNKHDGVFEPIEQHPFTNTPEQRFLFAYRSWLYSMHMKLQGSYSMDFGPEWMQDMDANKAIFDSSLLSQDWARIEGGMIQLPAFYPFAASGSFYLDFDFEGNAIPHSANRMEMIHVDLFPDGSKTIFLISYFKEDAHLYSHLIPQLKKRQNFRSDLAVLLGGHTENVYFEPDYFKTFIDGQASIIKDLLDETQKDHVYIEGQAIKDVTSKTPQDYLSNRHGLKLFGY